MSAKWRRRRQKTNKFDILKVFGKTKNKSVVQKFRIKNLGTKRQTNSCRYRVNRVSMEKRCREPKHLVDVMEATEDIVVVADFAGFNKDDLRVHVSRERLTVVAEASDRKYRKSLNLPKRVIPSTIRTTYKNGVLEIKLKKAEEKTISKIAG